MSQELKIQEPERQQWGSRLGFILASIGSAIGLGNMLRYPSVVWANNGAQWFIPYLIALFFIGIPLLLLEIAMGQTYRSGNYVSFGRINDRLRGLGAGTNINAFIVATYYQIIIAWVLVYFGYSFSSGALPWAENPADFFDNVVLRNVPVDKGNWDIVWTSVFLGAVVWFFVFLCLFKGVDSVGKVVYFTTGFPCIILIVLVIRGVTLENAGRGIHFYTGVWNMEQLYTPQIWQAAIGQIFFSIGAGFGTYTTYSSYNPKEQNAVQDCLIVGISNSLFEIIAGFAAFGIAGFLNLDPAKDKLSTFSLGFLTYPTALAQLPGAQIWCILFFFTLFLLGIDSAFALIEGLITMIEDSAKFQKVSRVAICSSVCFVGALCGLIYASDIGLSFLDKVDLYTNSFALPFSTFAECFALGFIYRYKDVIKQIGYSAYLVTVVAYIGPLLFCTLAAVTTSVSGMYLLVVGLAGFLFLMAFAYCICDTPTVYICGDGPVNKIYWLTLYPADQLRKDLNAAISTNGRWEIPLVWSFVMKFVTGPITFLLVVFSLTEINQIFDNVANFVGFLSGICIILFAVFGVIIPRFFDIFLPPGEKNQWKRQFEAGPGIVLEESQELLRKIDGK